MVERRKHGDDLTGRRDGFKVLKEEIQQHFRKIWGVVLVIGITSVIGIVGSCAIQQEKEDIANENRELVCSISRLISFVPAFQFEGESRENFLGWVEARRDILIVARNNHTCSPEVLELLKNRVALDTQLLEELQNSEKNP